MPCGQVCAARGDVPKGASMAAMKPRTGDGPLEVTKEGRGIVMRVPLEGGGRLVVDLNAEEKGAQGEASNGDVGGPRLDRWRQDPARSPGAGGVLAFPGPAVGSRSGSGRPALPPFAGASRPF